MSVKQRGNKWVVSIGSGKERIRESFNSAAEAKQYEIDETMRRMGAVVISPGSTALNTSLPMLLILAEQGPWVDCAARVKMKANAQDCINFLGSHLTAEDVTPEKLRNLAKHFNDRGLSGSTINRKLSSLSVMLHIAEDERWIQTAPRMPRRRESEHSIRYLTPEEETKMLQYCEHRGFENLADLIQFGCDTGFRKMEILNLKISDCKDTTAILHAGTTKSGKARAVPLTTRVRALVTKRRELGNTKLFEGYSEATLRKQWDGIRDYMKMVDDERFTVHMLRHTCASRLAQANKNASFIQAWLGHSSIMVTQRYMHLAPATLEDGLSALEGFQRAA